MSKMHFRPYTNKQILLFPQRIDENIAKDVAEEICFFLPFYVTLQPILMNINGI